MTAAELINQTSITTIWHCLGCGEIRRGRGQPKLWRQDADGWSVSISDRKGAWFDHRDAIGGGKLDLIQRVRGGSRADALRWLAECLGVALDGATLPREDRHRFARAREAAPELARRAGLWHAARCGELDEWKKEALERDDIALLMDAAKELHTLNSLAPQGIIRSFLQAEHRWPLHTRALVADGERWAQWSEAAVAALIAQWAHDAEDLDCWETDGGAAG